MGAVTHSMYVRLLVAKPITNAAAAAGPCFSLSIGPLAPSGFPPFLPPSRFSFFSPYRPLPSAITLFRPRHPSPLASCTPSPLLTSCIQEQTFWLSSCKEGNEMREEEEEDLLGAKEK